MWDRYAAPQLEVMQRLGVFMKMHEIIEQDFEPNYLLVEVPTDVFDRLTISLESIWKDSGYKDFMLRVDPEDPQIPLKRHVHIAKRKHTSNKNMQVSWNDDGTRHDRSSFNDKVVTTAVKAIARNALGLASDISLEHLSDVIIKLPDSDDVTYLSEGVFGVSIKYA